MTRIESEALVVRVVEFGEADAVATLFTEQTGKVGAVVRGARKGSRRVGGALEPVHTIAVLLEDRGGDLATLKEARIVKVRGRLATNLEALDAAGTALRWARHVFPPRTPEPDGWRVLIELMDVLERGEISPRAELARAGLGLLTAVGYGMELDRCVVCGRECPAGKPACVDPARGGLVCRACGGAATVLSPEERAAAQSLIAGRTREATQQQVAVVLQIVDRALGAHTGLEPQWR